jgi:hypothetical protein
MRTQDLIDLIAQDSVPAPATRRVLGIAIVAGLAIALCIFVMMIGPRPDIAAAAGTMRFLFKFVVTVALAVTAAGALGRLARPEAALGPWAWALAAAPLLLAAAVLAELIALPAATWMPRMIGHNARFCLTLVPLMAAGPLACLLAALRFSAPGRPALAGFVAGLAASGIAATLYAANCTDDSPLFVALWYPLAAGAMGLAGMIMGSRLLRW